jgi:hypothetical protein
MKYLLSLLLLVSNLAFAADPTLVITAPVQKLGINESTTVTFTFSEPVTGFDLTDAVIKGSGQYTSALSGSGTTYTVTFQKITDVDTVSILVNNNATIPDGHGATIGFNVQPKMYLKDGNLFNGKLIEAVPQPSCPKAGEILVNADNTPAAPLNEKYYTLGTNRRGFAPQEVKIGCLQRVLTGQKYVKKVAPKVHETNNMHGALNHAMLMPKVTQAAIQPLNGTTKTRVRPSNASYITLNSNGVVVHKGNILYDGLQTRSGGDARFANIASKVDFDDPIIYPNQKGRAHAHTYYGNNGVTHQTNNVSLLNSCVSLIAGGRANCTGYWMPSVIDTATNTALLPTSILIYYKAGLGHGFTEPLPKGLKIIAGGASRTPSSPLTDDIRFTCFLRDGTQQPDYRTIPACSGDTHSSIWLTVNFPNCVKDDGTGKILLDSPDHRSHLNPFGYEMPVINGERRCPTEYPHAISSIAQIAIHELKPGQNTATWRLSSDNYAANLASGASLHADWWGGWQDYWIARLVDQCNSRGFDCGVNYMGLNDGVGITNITTVGNVATITTAVPHLLKISNSDGTYPDFVGSESIQKLLGRITGVTGVSADAYNFDPMKSSSLAPSGARMLAPQGQQALKILNATQIEYTLNSTPTNPINGAVDPAVVKVQWGEEFCNLNAGCGSEAYNEFYYGNKS